MYKFCLVFFFLFHSGTYLFTQQTWNSPFFSAFWQTGQWLPVLPPYPNGPTGEAHFTTNISFSGDMVVKLSSDVEIWKIHIDYGPNTYTIGSSILEKLVFVSNSGSAEINVTNAVGNGAHTIGCPIDLQAPLLITQQSSGFLTFTRAISGTTTLHSLTKEGASTVVLAVPNTYSGGTFINEGTLSVADDPHLGLTSAPLTIDNGTLLFTGGASSARFGSFTGSSATIDTGGNAVSFAGSFAGAGGLTKLGAGTLVMSGNNSYQGSTTVSVGTLQVNSNSLPSNAEISLGATLSFNQGTNGIYTGVIDGSGDLIKTGSGRLHLTGDSSSFTGTTTILQGELKNNGSLGQSSLVHVLPGAILSGSGDVGPTVVEAGGTIIAGNSIGITTVLGPLVLAPGSFTPIDISPLNADLFIVTGTATVTDAILTIHPEVGFYGFQTSYTILTSAGLLGPGFAPPISTDPNFVPSLSYTATDVILTMQVSEPFASFPFESGNTQVVANEVETLFGSGEISTELLNFINSFAGHSFSDINRALDQIQPATYSAITEVQTETSAQLISLFRRFPTLCGCESSSRIWVKPFVNHINIKDDGAQVGFHNISSGIAIGLDQVVAEDFVVGVGGAWNRSNIGWKHHRGSGDVDGFYGSLYSNYLKNNFYLGGAVLAGADFCDTSRQIVFLHTNERAKADCHSLDAVAQVSTAYFFGPDYAQFYPYANIDFLYFQYGSLKETGAPGFNLSVNGRDASTIRTELGLGFESKYQKPDSVTCFSPFISIGWINMAPINRDPFRASFEGASTSFSVNGWDKTWNLLELEVSLKTSYKCFDFNLEYNLEISPSTHPTFFDQHGSASLSWKW